MAKSDTSQKPAKKRIVRRWLMRVVVFLLFGAVVNVAVAWVFVPIEGNDYESSDLVVFRWQPYETSSLSVLSMRKRGSWIIELLMGDVRWKQLPTKPSNVLQQLPAWCKRHIAKRFPETAVRDSVMFTLEARGWPLLCLWCESEGNDTTGIASGRSVYPYGGITVSGPPRSQMHEHRAIPLIPIWPGFAINTVIYAVILWLLFAAPFVLRRRERMRKGLCPKCAYPVGDSDVCTECGAAVKGQKFKRSKGQKVNTSDR